MKKISNVVPFETEIERDRRDCISIDARVTGVNRELAQWLVNHPQYSARVVATWLGCGPSRVGDLRRWAAGGFQKNSTQERRERRDNRRSDRRAGQEPQKSQENLEEETFVANPADVEKNLRFMLERHRAGAEACRKIVKVARLEDGACEGIRIAVKRLISKWKAVLSTLER